MPRRQSMPSKKIKVLAVVLAVLMGFSRLYVAVHNPSDVIAGALVGAFSGLIAVIIIKAWDDRKNRQPGG